METIKSNISEHTQNYLNCLDKFEAFRDELINALSEELGDDAAEDKLNRHAAVIIGTKKFVEHLVIDSITTTMGKQRSTKAV